MRHVSLQDISCVSFNIVSSIALLKYSIAGVIVGHPMMTYNRIIAIYPMWISHVYFVLSSDVLNYINYRRIRRSGRCDATRRIASRIQWWENTHSHGVFLVNIQPQWLYFLKIIKKKGKTEWRETVAVWKCTRSIFIKLGTNTAVFHCGEFDA